MEEDVIETLKKYGQEHLINFFDELENSEKISLEEEIRNINFEQIKDLYELTKTKFNTQDKIEPIGFVDKYKLEPSKREEYEKNGVRIIENGEYAVATMAGGQRNKTWA